MSRRPPSRSTPHPRRCSRTSRPDHPRRSTRGSACALHAQGLLCAPAGVADTGQVLVVAHSGARAQARAAVEVGLGLPQDVATRSVDDEIAVAAQLHEGTRVALGCADADRCLCSRADQDQVAIALHGQVGAGETSGGVYVSPERPVVVPSSCPSPALASGRDQMGQKYDAGVT